MNPSFKQALAARLLWVDVVMLERIEGSELELQAAIQAAYDAVHALAASDVLGGAPHCRRAPILLLDVPALADQYEVAFQRSRSEVIGDRESSWLTPTVPQDQPYSSWLAALTLCLAEGMNVSLSQENPAAEGHGFTMLESWNRGESVEETAELAISYYELRILDEEEEAHRKYCEDIADTYAFLEADLWEGWYEECEELDLVA